jgi:hypothetical protein
VSVVTNQHSAGRSYGARSHTGIAVMALQSAAGAGANVMLSVRLPDWWATASAKPRVFLCPPADTVPAIVRAAYRDTVRAVRVGSGPCRGADEKPVLVHTGAAAGRVAAAATACERLRRRV